MKRLMVIDTTVEALAPILKDNPRGLLLARDELSGWFGSFDRYASGGRGGSDEANWLSLFNAGSISIDRKTGTRQTIRARRASLCIAGGIQPGVLARTLLPEDVESGMAARFLMAHPPRIPKAWTESSISEQLEERVSKLFDRIYSLDFMECDGEGNPAIVEFSPEAKTVWVDYYNSHAQEQIEQSGGLASAWSKFEEYAARLALVIHFIRLGASGEPIPNNDLLSESDMRAGIELTRWFKREAIRLYALFGEQERVEADENDSQRKLIGWIEGKGGRVTAREVLTGCRWVPDADAADYALRELIKAKRGSWETPLSNPNGGRPTRIFVLCPPPAVSASAEPQKRPETRSSADNKGEPGADRVSSADANSQPKTASNRTDALSAKPLKVGQKQPALSAELKKRPETKGFADADSADTSEISHYRTDGSILADTAGLRLLSDAESVLQFAKRITTSGIAVGLDTETTGLNPDADRVRLLQLATADGIVIIDLLAFENPAQAIKPLLEALATVGIVGHNLAFDIRFLAKLGFVPKEVFCTMLASQVLHAGERVGHKLSDVLLRELEVSVSKDEQKSNWAGNLSEAQLRYAADDVRHLRTLADTLREKLDSAKLTSTTTLEMQALLGIASSKPITVDRDSWLSLAKKAEADRERLVDAMDELAPNPATFTQSRNWNSNPEVIAAFKQLNIMIPNTADETLAAIDHPLATMLREYRAACKRTSTYGTKWLRDHAADGVVHCGWNQCGAESGRMSCKSPNLQQIPRTADYRKCFIARPGCVLIKADYSQIELRIAAKLADETTMIEAYQRGDDLHALTASNILGKKLNDVSKADRQLAKAINFGLLFGMGYRSLRKYAATNYGTELSEAQAKQYRDAFFRTYPKLKAWHQRTTRILEQLAAKNPNAVYETRSLAGRRRLLPVSKKNAKGERYPNLNEALESLHDRSSIS